MTRNKLLEIYNKVMGTEYTWDDSEEMHSLVHEMRGVIKAGSPKAGACWLIDNFHEDAWTSDCRRGWKKLETMVKNILKEVENASHA